MHGHRRRGSPTFCDTIKRDLGAVSKFELKSCMSNRDDWCARLGWGRHDDDDDNDDDDDDDDDDYTYIYVLTYSI